MGISAGEGLLCLLPHRADFRGVAGGCPGPESRRHALLFTLLLGDLLLLFLIPSLFQLLSSRLNGSSGILSGCLVTMLRKPQVMMTENSTHLGM